MVAFFGMGLLGSSFVRALLEKGERVHVWNRSADKARSLEVHGAKAFDDPAEAARGAARVHLTLSDDAAVDDVLEKARAGFEGTTIIVDHTTTSPTGTAARAARWKERGVAFQHAPVFMAPQNARESTGLMLASGDRALYDALEPSLSKMTGKLVWLGEAPERAAAFKLMGNAFLMSVVAGIADVFAIGKATNVAPADAAGLFDLFNPGALAPTRAKRMLEGTFSKPSWELAMARKDARLMIEETTRAGVALALIPAIAEHMDACIARGEGKHDWTVIAKDALTRG
jgi:3-hydroxyisobutyrate dehydrogenase